MAAGLRETKPPAYGLYGMSYMKPGPSHDCFAAAQLGSADSNGQVRHTLVRGDRC